MSDSTATIVAIHKVISVGWAKDNPELFHKSYVDFFKAHPKANWEITAHADIGNITLMAKSTKDVR